MSHGNNEEDQNSAKYKGVRRRKWGKWVSEIRVPGSQSRLWLGSYATPEAAAVAHDVAFYCLRRPASLDALNFPQTLHVSALRDDMSPRSVQQAASDAGLAVDAHYAQFSSSPPGAPAAGVYGGGPSGFVTGEADQFSWNSSPDGLSVSVEDYL